MSFVYTLCKVSINSISVATLLSLENSAMLLSQKPVGGIDPDTADGSGSQVKHFSSKPTSLHRKLLCRQSLVIIV